MAACSSLAGSKLKQQFFEDLHAFCTSKNAIDKLGRDTAKELDQLVTECENCTFVEITKERHAKLFNEQAYETGTLQGGQAKVGFEYDEQGEPIQAVKWFCFPKNQGTNVFWTLEAKTKSFIREMHCLWVLSQTRDFNYVPRLLEVGGRSIGEGEWELYLIMEYGGSKTLQDFGNGGSLDRESLRSVVSDLVDALMKIEQLPLKIEQLPVKIAHRDLHAGNVLRTGLAKPSIKICDFGFSRTCSSNDSPGLWSVRDVLEFLPPEMSLKRIGALTTKQQYDLARVDVFSFGCLLARLLNFSTNEDESTIPESFKSLIEQCTKSEPKERFQSFSDIQQAISRISEHDWLEVTCAVGSMDAKSSSFVYSSSWLTNGDNTPVVPGWWLPRKSEEEKLVEQLHQCVADNTLSRCIVVRGPGGQGKSTFVAATLSNQWQHEGEDNLIKQAFPDGVHWITVQRGSDGQAEMNRLVEWLHKSERADTVEQTRCDESTEQSIRSRLLQATQTRKLLVVLDNVENTHQVMKFVRGLSSGCTIIATTRSHLDFDAQPSELEHQRVFSEIQIAPLTPKESVELLTRVVFADEAQTRFIEPTASVLSGRYQALNDIAMLCKSSPMLLELVGTQMVKDKTVEAWTKLAKQVRNRSNEPLEERITDLIQSNLASLDALSLEVFRRLSVFKQKTWISESTVSLWLNSDNGIRDDLIASQQSFDDILTCHVDGFLLSQRQGEGNERFVQLHDIVFDWLINNETTVEQRVQWRKDLIGALMLMLRDSDSDVRSNIRWELGNCTVKGDRDAIAALIPMLHDPDSRVRWFACWALGDIAEKGDGDVIAALIPILHDLNSGVRKNACSALGNVALKGDRDVIAALISMLHDHNSDVRSNVWLTLGNTALKGDRDVIAALIPMLHDPNSNIRWRAWLTLGNIASKGDRDVIGALIPMLDDPDSNICKNARKVLGNIAVKGDRDVIATLIPMLHDPNPNVRWNARSVLGNIAVKGDGVVIAALIPMFRDPDSDVRSDACEALGNIALKGDRDVIAALIPMLHDTDSHVRSNACSALGKIAEKGDGDVIAALIPMLHDPDSHVRSNACRALEDIAVEGDRDVIAALIPMLHDSGSDVRKGARSALGKIAETGDGDVIAALIPILHDPDSHVRSNACSALGKIAEKGDGDVIAALIPMLHDPNSNVRSNAWSTLGEVAAKGDRDVIAALIPMLHDPDSNIRRSACRALGNIASKGDRDVIAALIPMLHDPNSHVRWFACEALGNIASKGDRDVIAALIPMLHDSDSNIRSRAWSTLGNIALKGDRDVIAALIPMLRDSNSDDRWRAWSTLGNIALKGDRDVIAALIPLLHDFVSDVRENACKALGNIAVKGDRDVIAALILMLRDSDPLVHLHACLALGKIAEKGDRDVIAALIPLLRDSDSNVRSDASLALSKIAEKGDRDVIAALIFMLRDPNSLVRVSACRALGNIASKGDRDVIAALIPMLRDPDSNVRSDASLSLGNIAMKGDRDVIAALISMLHDHNSNARSSACRALGNIASKGDRDVIAALIPMLHDFVFDVRCAAGTTLLRLSSEFDSQLGQLSDIHIQELLALKRCTSITTEENASLQRCYECVSCNFPEDQVACASCFEKCHAGHEVIPFFACRRCSCSQLGTCLART